MRRKVALLLAHLSLVSTAPTASASEPYQVTVMSRNLYLGADVGVALLAILNAVRIQRMKFS